LRQSLKISISFLISLIIAFLFVVFGASGLFTIIETNFYIPRIQTYYTELLEKIDKEVKKSIESSINLFNGILDNDYIPTAFLTNQGKSLEDIQAREREFARLKETFPDLLFVRFVGTRGRKIYFSTNENDIRTSRANQRVYFNYDQVDKDSDINRILREKNDPPNVYVNAKNNRLIYSFPVIDSYDVFKGTALFYVSKEHITRKLLLSPEFEIKDDIILIEDMGILLNFPGELSASTEEEVQDIWGKNNRNSEFSDIIISTEEKKGKSFTLLTRRTDYIEYLALILPGDIFEIPQLYKIIMLILLFFTLYIVIYLLFNIKQDPLLIISRRIKYLQIQFLKQFIEAQEEIDWKRWQRDLYARESEIKKQIKKGVGKIENEKEVDHLIDKSWNNILTIISKKAGEEKTVSLDVSKIEEAIAKVLKSGHISIPVRKVQELGEEEKEKQEETEREKQDQESLEEIGEAEEEDELESLEEVEEVEEADELESLEEVEEAEEADELESLEEAGEVEEADELESLEEAGEVEEADELESLEEAGEVEEADELESLEEVEEAGEVDELEPLEEIGEAEETVEIEPLEEVGEVEKADELESLEEVGEAGEVDELEPLEEIGEAEETVEIEPLEEVEEVEEVSETGQPEVITETDEIEQIPVHSIQEYEKPALNKQKDEKTPDFTITGEGEESLNPLPSEPFEQLEELELAASPDEYTYDERGGKYYLLRKEMLKDDGKNGTGKQDQSESIIFFEPLKKTKKDIYKTETGVPDDKDENKTEQDEFRNRLNKKQIRLFSLEEIVAIMKESSEHSDENIVMENGVYTISRNVLDAKHKPKDLKLKELVDSVKDGVDRIRKGGEKVRIIKDMINNTDPDAKKIPFSSSYGIDYDSHINSLKKQDKLSIMKSLVEFSKDLNAFVTALLIPGENEYAIDISVGLQEKSKRYFKFSMDEIYSTEVFRQKKVCIIYIPLRELHFLKERLDDLDKKYINSLLFIPARFKNKDAYFIFGFSSKIKGSIKDIVNNLPLRFVK
jgi:hypothetical protein